jgi:hypothetical protein
MEAMPYPDPGGDIEELKEFFHLRPGPEGKRDWTLIVAWLLGVFSDGGPYPILNVQGEQDSAKTTATRIAKYTVDPHSVLLENLPRNDRDLAISAGHSLVLAYDNVSKIPDWLSDNFCRVATGGGFVTRKLYSNDELQFFVYTRPCIFNGISQFTSRHDLIDRSIYVTLAPVPDEERVTEEELNSKFEKARPRILGGLLNAVSTTLKNLSTTSLDSIPRMADFAKFVCAAEPALSWDGGEFLNAYDHNRKFAIESSLEFDPLSKAIQKLVPEGEQWQGTFTELRERFGYEDEEGKWVANVCQDDGKKKQVDSIITREQSRQKAWPKDEKAISRRLNRQQNFLRRIGIEIIHLPRTAARKEIKIVNYGSTKNIVTTSPTSLSKDNNNLANDDKNGCDDNIVTGENNVIENSEELQGDDDNDDNDDIFPTSEKLNQSKPTPERCGDCEHYFVDKGWIGCNREIVENYPEKIKNLDSCPEGKTWPDD